MAKYSSKRILAALALAVGAAAAHAVPVVRSGNLVDNTDVVEIAFTLASAAPVSIWTDSWSAGLNFDPTISVFDAASTLLVATGDDTPDPTLLHAGQGGYDGELDFTLLAAGRYVLTLSASGNDPVGPTLAAGFSLAGTTPIAIADWNQPSYDINRNDQKGTFWRVNVEGSSAVAAVPEPSEIVMLTVGLAVVAALVRRRRAS